MLSVMSKKQQVLRSLLPKFIKKMNVMTVVCEGQLPSWYPSYLSGTHYIYVLPSEAGKRMILIPGVVFLLVLFHCFRLGYLCCDSHHQLSKTVLARRKSFRRYPFNSFWVLVSDHNYLLTGLQLYSKVCYFAVALAPLRPKNGI